MRVPRADEERKGETVLPAFGAEAAPGHDAEKFLVVGGVVPAAAVVTISEVSVLAAHNENELALGREVLVVAADT